MFKGGERHVRNGIIAGISFFIVVIISLIVGGYFYVGSAYKNINYVDIDKNNVGGKTPVENRVDNIPNEASSEIVEEKVKDIRNIALFGIDAPEGQFGRSDSIIILTLDNINNKIKVTSIMRDSYVDISGHGMDKINHAYAFGGSELALKTLNENFELNMTEFVAVNFISLPAIVDRLGGVDIQVTDEEVSHISGVTKAGMQTLNGEQALAYSRIRYATGGDYKRTDRQREVIKALFNKGKTINKTEYIPLATEFLGAVTTNLKLEDIFNIIKNYGDLVQGDVEGNRFPTDEQCIPKTINGIYYLTFDRDVVKKSIHDYIFEN